MENREAQGKLLKKRVTRRDAIKAGGIAAVGLAFSKPIIETIYPKSAFAQLSPKPPTDPLGACFLAVIQSDVGAQAPVTCIRMTESDCASNSGLWQGPETICVIE